MSDEVKTAEEIAQDYKAMGDSVTLINEVIAGTAMEDETDEDKKSCVSRNVEHLELMKDKDYWTNEDFTGINSAITSGNTYTS
jgi:hypothetical protein